MIGMGDKLVASHHFAREQIQRKLDELQDKWEVLRGVVEERVELLDLSVSFHDSQQKVRILRKFLNFLLYLMLHE